jgi:hypothetical protein
MQKQIRDLKAELKSARNSLDLSRQQLMLAQVKIDTLRADAIQDIKISKTTLQTMHSQIGSAMKILRESSSSNQQTPSSST